MSLEVQFSNGTILPAREAVLSRALGRAVRWTYEVFIPPERRKDDLLPKLAGDLGSKRITAVARFSGQTGGDAEFGLEGVVTHASWGRQADHVVVEVQNTRLAEEKPNPLLPRWRIHHVDDMQKLAQKFGHLATFSGSPVKNALSGVTFSDGERANVVQAGVSDWDFLAMMLWQYRLLGKDDKLKPMILSGSVDPGTESKWVYTWGSKQAFEAAGEISRRTVTFAENDGYERPMFAGRSGEVPSPHSILPHATIPRSGLLRHRRAFTAQAWDAWRKKDVPLFLDGMMCWRVVDRLYDTGDPDRAGWTTMLEFLPPEGLAPQEFPPRPARAWMGEGTVKKNYRKGPWIDIELPAFTSEHDENVVHTRLTTIHSGQMGHAGVHLIPEVKTHVEVAWSGRFDESVVCLGNRRMKEVEHRHPSLWIESDSIGEYANITVKSIGTTTIQSDWKVDVEKQTVLTSRQPLKLVGDGVKAHYKGGVIHISKDKAAMEDIRETLKDHPQLVQVLEKYMADKEHPMNIVGYLRSPKIRPVVLQRLKRMAELEEPDLEAMRKTVADSDRDDVALFRSNDKEFSQRNGEKGSAVLRRDLLASDPELFSTGTNPTPGQQAKLDAHAKRLREDVLPGLTGELEGLVSDLRGPDGFPAVNSRAKSAAGMVDKIGRMRAGNEGKAPRPDYSLADMPDAVGGRITVRSPEELQTVMGRLEQKFGKDAIFEKDNFYSNPNKRQGPYRCITYTVMHQGAPCEVQLTTLDASLTADLWHNTGYKKNIHPDMPQSSTDRMGGLQRAVTADEHRSLARRGK